MRKGYDQGSTEVHLSGGGGRPIIITRHMNCSDGTSKWLLNRALLQIPPHLSARLSLPPAGPAVLMALFCCRHHVYPSFYFLLQQHVTEPEDDTGVLVGAVQTRPAP